MYSGLLLTTPTMSPPTCISPLTHSPKGESTYNVIDHGSRAVIEVEDLECRPGVTYPKHTFGEQTTVAQATWAISTANVSDAFLVILLDNAYRKSEKYIFVAQNRCGLNRIWHMCCIQVTTWGRSSKGSYM